MLNRYYEDELTKLRTLAAEFSKANPALAPMLSGMSADPDVERLLEGVAFLTGMARQKLDDEFPEFVQEIANLLFPHFLRPVPATSVVAFLPRGAQMETVLIPAGTELGRWHHRIVGVAVDRPDVGNRCRAAPQLFPVGAHFRYRSEPEILKPPRFPVKITIFAVRTFPVRTVSVYRDLRHDTRFPIESQRFLPAETTSGRSRTALQGSIVQGIERGFPKP